MFIAADGISEQIVERLRYTELPEPSMFESKKMNTILYSVPLRHVRSTMFEGNNVPVIRNWVMLDSPERLALFTNCKLICGDVPEEYRAVITALFRKVEHQGLLDFSDINAIALAFGVYDIFDINLISNMFKTSGIYMGPYRGSSLTEITLINLPALDAEMLELDLDDEKIQARKRARSRNRRQSQRRTNQSFSAKPAVRITL